MYKRKPIRLIALLMTLCMLLSVLPGSGLRTEAAEADAKQPESTSSAEVQLSAATQTLSEDCKILNYVQPEVFASAKHVARITSEETLNSYVFLNEDGTRTAYFMDEAVKYVDEKGLVQEKDLTLVPAVGGYTTEKNDISLSIPTNPASGVTLLWNNTAVRIIPQGGTVGETVVEDNAVRYVDYYGNGMDLVYTPTLSGLKEDIVLESYTGNNTFTFMLNTGGLNLYSASGRYYLAASKTATDRIDLGDVVTFDARGRFSVGTMSAQTVTAGQIYRLTLTVDEDFLTDPNTVYPVSIDPTLTVSDNTHGAGAIEDVSIYQGRPTINANWTYLHSGYYDSNYTVARTLIRLTGLINSSVYQGLTANQISSVQFHIWEASGTATTSVYLRANTGSATWTESGATWNNAGVVLGTTYDTQNLISNSKATFNITQLVKDWKSGTQNAQKGFVLQSSNETSLDKAFYSSEHSNTDRRPYVVLNYDSTQNSIAMSATTLSVNEGSTATIQAVTTPEDLALTWSSNNTSVATVDSTGKVTGVKAGVATITASAPGVASATCTVYVTLSQNAVYRIRNMAGATLLDCNGANIAEENLTNVQVQTLISVGNDKLAQMWRIIYIGGGFYHIRPMHKLDYALYLDGADVKLKNIGISGSVTTANANARWTIEYINGGYVFKNVGLFSRTLQPVGGSVTNGKAVNTAIINSDYEYQRWSLTTMTLPPHGCLIYDLGTGKAFDAPRRGVGLGQTVATSDLNIVFAFYSLTSIAQTATWTSENPSVATVNVSTGAITGVTNGQTTITATRILDGVSSAYSFDLVVSPIPISGYELEYNQSLWNYEPVLFGTNCYAYALNNQVHPGTNQCWYMNPGEASTGGIVQSDIDEDTVLACVEADADELGFVFTPIGKYEVCPAGTYKVALVIRPGVDYHWYRQNTDGTWSHKLATNLVTDLDGSDIIIWDPETADRYHTPVVNYPQFIGYFAVSPLNSMYSEPNLISNTTPDGILYEAVTFSLASGDSELSPMSIVTQISKGMTYSETSQIIGHPQRPRTSGLLVVEYDLNDGNTLVVEYVRQDTKLVVHDFVIEESVTHE